MCLQALPIPKHISLLSFLPFQIIFSNIAIDVYLSFFFLFVFFPASDLPRDGAEKRDGNDGQVMKNNSSSFSKFSDFI